MRVIGLHTVHNAVLRFPFLFGGTFIEGSTKDHASMVSGSKNFPSFSEGLSLRASTSTSSQPPHEFPFLFGGTFIEGDIVGCGDVLQMDFPSFSEGLSLRAELIHQ